MTILVPRLIAVKTLVGLRWEDDPTTVPVLLNTVEMVMIGETTMGVDPSCPLPHVVLQDPFTSNEMLSYHLFYRGTEDERARSTTVYVGNIPYSFIERDVSELFERYGRIRKVTVPMDRFTRRNRGFAFVEFEDRRDAEDAFHKFNDYQIEGRRLRCDWDVGMDRKQVGPAAGERPSPRSHNEDHEGDGRRPHDDRRHPSPPRRMRD